MSRTPMTEVPQKRLIRVCGTPQPFAADHIRFFQVLQESSYMHARTLQMGPENETILITTSFVR